MAPLAFMSKKSIILGASFVILFMVGSCSSCFSLNKEEFHRVKHADMHYFFDDFFAQSIWTKRASSQSARLSMFYRKISSVALL